jgi:starch-binding outer membrane protein, SusD/RagB family
MNKIKKYLTITILFLIVYSCQDFLERYHPGELTYDKFYTTEEDFQASLNACYRSLWSQCQLILYFSDVMSDNVWCDYYVTGDGVNFNSCNIPTNSSIIKSFWGSCYHSITYANMVITRIADTEIPESTKEVFVDEAKFIRAYSYFNLVRIYGGVPKYETELQTLSEIYEIGRSDINEIYDFIISDLNDVLNIDVIRSPEQIATSKGKATSIAAKALLGKVYLQKGDYQNALNTLSDITNNSGLELEYDLGKLYDPDDFNKEVLFALNYERVSGQSSPFTGRSLPRYSRGILPNVTTSDNGSGEWMLEPYTVAKFSSEDKRKTLIDSMDIDFGGEGIIKFYYTKKYLDIETTSDFHSASDFIVLRYTDVLLMYADALNQTGKTGDAYQYINQIRNRAGLDPLPSGYTKEQMDHALANERQKEFIMEGDRWFDLSFRGFDYLKNTLNEFFPNSARFPNASIEDHEVLFPIPSDEVNLKPDYLKQNPGY